MKAYLDANIYVCYLLGEKGEAEIDRLFEIAAKCRFSLVGSNTAFAEVQRRCGYMAVPLLQTTINKLQKAGKLAIVNENEGEITKAIEMNATTGNRFGRNDFIHAILASRYADVFVTNDREFSGEASKIVETRSLADFLRTL